MVCDVCAYEDAPGAKFCSNQGCQAFLQWDATDTQPRPASPPGAAPPAASKPGATKPGATKPGATKPAVEPTAGIAVRPPLKCQFLRERPAPVAVVPPKQGHFTYLDSSMSNPKGSN